MEVKSKGEGKLGGQIVYDTGERGRRNDVKMGGCKTEEASNDE